MLEGARCTLGELKEQSAVDIGKLDQSECRGEAEAALSEIDESVNGQQQQGAGKEIEIELMAENSEAEYGDKKSSP